MSEKTKNIFDVSKIGSKRVTLKSTGDQGWIEIKQMTLGTYEDYMSYTNKYSDSSSEDTEDVKVILERVSDNYIWLSKLFQEAIIDHNLSLCGDSIEWTPDFLKKMPTILVTEITEKITKAQQLSP